MMSSRDLVCRSRSCAYSLVVYPGDGRFSEKSVELEEVADFGRPVSVHGALRSVTWS